MWHQLFLLHSQSQVVNSFKLILNSIPLWSSFIVMSHNFRGVFLACGDFLGFVEHDGGRHLYLTICPDVSFQGFGILYSWSLIVFQTESQLLFIINGHALDCYINLS